MNTTSFPGNKPALQGTVTTHELILTLRKRAWIYLLLVVLAGAAAFWYTRYHILTYSAEASFYMNDPALDGAPSPALEGKPYAQIQPTEQFNRIFQMVNSSRVYNHLILHFNLLKRYGIDTTREFYYERAIDILRSRIEVKKNLYGVITVTVSDSYRYKAAEMANEIVAFLNTLNQRQIVESLQRKLNVYRELTGSAGLDVNKHTRHLDSLMYRLQEMMSRMDNRPGSSIVLLQLQEKVREAMENMKASMEELEHTQRYYTAALQSANNKNLPSLVPVLYARPSHHSLAWPSFVYACLFMLFAIALIVLLNYYALRYGHYLRLIFRGK